MTVYKIYQIDLGPIHNEINELGHEGAANKFPQYRAYLETTMGGEGYIPDYAAEYTHVADCEAADLEDCFELMNTCNRAADERITLHSTRCHSLSVGDIVIDGDGQAWFTDSIGFVDVEFKND